MDFILLLHLLPFVYIYCPIIVAVSGSTPLDFPCNSDADCGVNAFCFYLTVVPACKKGSCQCTSTFLRSSSSQTDCFAPMNLQLGQPCGQSDIVVYPYGANCRAYIVQCQTPYYIQASNKCQLSPMAAGSTAGSPCTDDFECDLPEKGLTCNLASRQCFCANNYVYNSIDHQCEEAYYGSPCQGDINCQLGGTFTASGEGGGGVCDPQSLSCACAEGFEAVAYTDIYMDSTTTANTVQSTWQICVVNNSMWSNAGGGNEGDSCTPCYTSVIIGGSTIPQSAFHPQCNYCSTGLACVVCPEDYTPLTAIAAGTAQGTCRSGSAPSKPYSVLMVYFLLLISIAPLAAAHVT